MIYPSICQRYGPIVKRGSCAGSQRGGNVAKVKQQSAASFETRHAAGLGLAS